MTNDTPSPIEVCPQAERDRLREEVRALNARITELEEEGRAAAAMIAVLAPRPCLGRHRKNLLLDISAAYFAAGNRFLQRVGLDAWGWWVEKEP